MVFYDMTPREVFFALQDFELTHFLPSRSINETLRVLMQIVTNKGLRKEDRITDPKKIIRFSWEESEAVRVQTAEEMREVLLNIAAIHGAKKGSIVDEHTA